MAHDGCKLVSKTRLTLTGYGFDPCTFRQFLERQIPHGVWRSFRFRVPFLLPDCNPGAVSEHGDCVARGSSPRGPTIINRSKEIEKNIECGPVGKLVKSLPSGGRVLPVRVRAGLPLGCACGEIGKRSTLRACDFGLWVQVPPRAPYSVECPFSLLSENGRMSEIYSHLRCGIIEPV